MAGSLDLDAYLERVGWSGDLNRPGDSGQTAAQPGKAKFAEPWLTGHAQAARAHPEADAAHEGAQSGTDRRRLAGLRAGWKAYFRLAQTPGVMRELDEWLRHRLRAVQLKQWRRGTTMFRTLQALGASVDLAVRIAGNARRWWRNSCMALNKVLPVEYFDRLGVPRFS